MTLCQFLVHSSKLSPHADTVKLYQVTKGLCVLFLVFKAFISFLVTDQGNAHFVLVR